MYVIWEFEGCALNWGVAPNPIIILATNLLSDRDAGNLSTQLVDLLEGT